MKGVFFVLGLLVLSGLSGCARKSLGQGTDVLTRSACMHHSKPFYVDGQWVLAGKK